MDRERLIDGIVEAYPPARDAEQARAGLNLLNDDQISDLHGRITATHARAVALLTNREERTKARKAMIGELAGALTFQTAAPETLGIAFDLATAHFERLSNEELAKEYAGLKAIDAMPSATDGEIVWSDGSDDEKIQTSDGQHFNMT